MSRREHRVVENQLVSIGFSRNRVAYNVFALCSTTMMPVFFWVFANVLVTNVYSRDFVLQANAHRMRHGPTNAVIRRNRKHDSAFRHADKNYNFRNCHTIVFGQFSRSGHRVVFAFSSPSRRLSSASFLTRNPNKSPTCQPTTS